MLMILFDSQGVLHKEFLPEGKPVIAEFYKGVMDRLLKHIQRVRPVAFCSQDFFLLHNNAPAHKAASVCQFLTQKNVTTLYHLPYSPDLSPPDYYLFPKLKKKLKGLHFADVAEIQEAVTDELKNVQKRGIFSNFSETVQLHKSLYICHWSLFWIKKR
jgi:histone-lysine N-methyltransferase SETMAR